MQDLFEAKRRQLPYELDTARRKGSKFVTGYHPQRFNRLKPETFKRRLGLMLKFLWNGDSAVVSHVKDRKTLGELLMAAIHDPIITKPTFHSVLMELISFEEFGPALLDSEKAELADHFKSFAPDLLREYEVFNSPQSPACCQEDITLEELIARLHPAMVRLIDLSILSDCYFDHDEWCPTSPEKEKDLKVFSNEAALSLIQYSPGGTQQGATAINSIHPIK